MGHVQAEVETVIVGKSHVVRLLVVGLASGGHVLIEDIPGVGKTMLARSIAKAIGGTFKRIQFTPDLLPADVTGSTIYDQRSGQFTFRPGPIFAHIVVADEINRATPKSQSALLECMEEAQVTVDGVTHPLPRPFFVIATENPVEFRGTHPLPETQLDRFLLRIQVGYPSFADEIEIMTRQTLRHPIQEVQPVVTAEQIVEVQQAIRTVYVAESVKEYIVNVVAATRNHPYVALGCSPRGSLALFRSGQAMAALGGRDFVLPEDIKPLAHVVLPHRMIVDPRAAGEGVSSRVVVEEILSSVEVPLVSAREARTPARK